MSLNKVRNYFLDKIQNEDVSSFTPKYDAFEVEDITNSTNFVVVIDKTTDIVCIYDTSRKSSGGFRRRLIVEKPFGSTESAEDYYKYLYHKSLKAEDNICFLGYVDHNFQPIEE